MPNLSAVVVLALAVAGQIEPGRQAQASPPREPFKQLFLTQLPDPISTDDKLLEQQAALRRRHRALAPVSSSQPRLERGPCNMPIVRANPGIDAGIVVPIERGGSEAKIRVIEPTQCGQGPRAAEIVR
ncbi:MAG: hypothetical protein H0W08_05535 [Acidobacteria bacterium]|nr:hypothetical protein [Acidobacteriota bacterium]